MDLGTSWADAYIENQQKEQSYLIFINQLPKIHHNVSRDEPMGLGAPWDDAYLEPQQKEKSSLMFINTCPTTHQKVFRD